MQNTGEQKRRKNSIISLTVFVIALVIISLNLVSLFFPSLIVVIASGSEIQDDPFEAGSWIFPFLVTYLSLLVFGILYYTKKLPQLIRNSIKFILNFEVSSRVAAAVFVIILSMYIGLTMEEILLKEELIYGDFDRVEKVINKWPFNLTKADALSNRHVGNFFLKVSQVVFENMKVTPFLASISLLLVTYFFTVKITKKRFAGIVAMIILFQSFTFYSFDTLASYPNFWALFYLLSLYLIYKKWHLSPIAYVASLLSKPLTAPYLPMLLFFTYKAEIPRRKKIYIAITYIALALVAVAVLLIADVSVGGGITSGGLTFDWVDFWFGFTSWPAQLRFDGLFLLFVLPVTVGLFIISRRGVPIADAIIVQIVGIIFVMALLSAITDFNLHPYRYVPLIVFFAIGVGTLLSKKIN